MWTCDLKSPHRSLIYYKSDKLPVCEWHWTDASFFSWKEMHHQYHRSRSMWRPHDTDAAPCWNYYSDPKQMRMHTTINRVCKSDTCLNDKRRSKELVERFICQNIETEGSRGGVRNGPAIVVKATSSNTASQAGWKPGSSNSVQENTSSNERSKRWSQLNYRFVVMGGKKTMFCKVSFLFCPTPFICYQSTTFLRTPQTSYPAPETFYRMKDCCVN